MAGLHDALVLSTIFSNARRMLDTPRAASQVVIRDLPGIQGWHRSDMMERVAIIKKYQSLISKDIRPIEQRITSASDAKFLKAVIEADKGTIALVLALSREMWLNQKKLWMHLEEYTKSKMWPDCIDKEIAEIEALANKYQLILP